MLGLGNFGNFGNCFRFTQAISILKNALGQFILNRLPKHVIAGTNLCG